MIKIDTAPGGILSACFTLLYLSVAYIFFDITELDAGNAWVEFLTIGLCGLIGTISTLIILFFYHKLFPDLKYDVKKLIKSIGEKCKISIRNIRREANEDLKKLLKSKEIGEDEEKNNEKKIQNITDDHIKIVDEKISSKEKEIMTI